MLASMSTSAIAGLLCADQDYKVRAADRVARHIVTRLTPAPLPDRDQLALPF